MKTATEVGGDYYDFHLAEDGTLTVAIGDATGHGTKAGTVVTAAKSLLHVLAQNDDSPHVFRRFAQTLKSMNLGRMYMALTLIKFLDYPEAKNIFAEVAEQSPHEIIAHLIKAGETWANGRPQEKVVTFVLLKNRSGKNSVKQQREEFPTFPDW